VGANGVGVVRFWLPDVSRFSLFVVIEIFAFSDVIIVNFAEVSHAIFKRTMTAQAFTADRFSVGNAMPEQFIHLGRHANVVPTAAVRGCADHQLGRREFWVVIQNGVNRTLGAEAAHRFCAGNFLAFCINNLLADIIFQIFICTLGEVSTDQRFCMNGGLMPRVAAKRPVHVIRHDINKVEVVFYRVKINRSQFGRRCADGGAQLFAAFAEFTVHRHAQFMHHVGVSFFFFVHAA